MSEEIYQNRDRMLGEIHAEVKGMKEWRKEHEKKDEDRFFWGAVAILLIAVFTGSVSQLTAFALEHVK